MREIIYITVDRSGARRMTKNMPQLNRGEIPIKVQLTVDDEAFRTPVISKEIHVTDWREGIDIADVEFKENIITPEEAELIKQQRIQKMTQILQNQGYKVEAPVDPADQDDAQ